MPIRRARLGVLALTWIALAGTGAMTMSSRNTNIMELMSNQAIVRGTVARSPTASTTAASRTPR